MSEYWKSTPKYWCKFCSLYVKDTKFDRKQHEATGRHQGNIQRSLRGLHREKAAEDRQQQRAKDEVARLNGLVPGSGSSASASAPGGDTRVGAKPIFTKAPEKEASLDDRKRQANELAAMGITVPEEMRGEFAMAGDWHVVSETPIGEDGKTLNSGVHKRKLDEDEEEAIAAGEMVRKKKGWGNTYKSFPGKTGGADDDFDSFIKQTQKPVVKTEPEDKIKSEPDVKDESVLKEDDALNSVLDIPTKEEADAIVMTVKAEEEVSAPPVVFKKRKKVR